MSTIAIVGAGPGLGAAVARQFGSHNHNVALISRSLNHVTALADQLTDEGITAKGYAADVSDRGALKTALEAAATDLGAVEVLQYSPIPAQQFLRPLLESTVEDLAAAHAFSVAGSVTAVQTVLRPMQKAQTGTVLFVNGRSAVAPNASVAGTSIAFAGESAYAQMLHTVLADDGIYVGQLIVPGAIRDGDPAYGPDVLARTLWAMHTERGQFRHTAG
ncbi:SDR family NAD(P)-dependent oxidoreductase [Pedococcus sp. P5_B7]